MLSRSLSRSPSPDLHRFKSSYRHERLRDKDRARDKSRSPSHHRSDERSRPEGIDTISEDDYFIKSAEFSRWLRIEKGKYFDELRADKARSYFRKFVKAWNRGKLQSDLYKPLDSTSIPSNQQTAFKWTFAFKQSSADDDELDRIRKSVGSDTYGASNSSIKRDETSDSSGKRIIKGPTLPSSSDFQLAREEAGSMTAANNLLKRKREKLEDKERLEDLVGPKEVGREGMLEKKRAKRETDRAVRDARDDGGFEVSESVLMGGGDSFKERLAQRDAARARFESNKRTTRDAQERERSERAEKIKERDRKTMEMFQKMAKERFG